MSRRATSRPVPLRRRAGSWRSFVRRFQPLEAPDGDQFHMIGTLPAPVDPRHWWTLVDCDGTLYLTPGLRLVNRLGYLRCARPRSDDDMRQPDYRY